MTRDYELGFILHSEVNEEQTRAILERIEQIVTNYGGQVVRVNQWGRRRLAYPIQHNRDGFYVFIDMILTPETVGELDRTLKVSEEVLRHLITKRDPRIAQKEREARAAAAVQAAAAPEVEAPVGETPVDEVPVGEAPVDEAPAEESASVEEPVATENEVLVAANPEESDSVQPAVEAEETVEA